MAAFLEHEEDCEGFLSTVQPALAPRVRHVQQPQPAHGSLEALRQLETVLSKQKSQMELDVKRHRNQLISHMQRHITDLKQRQQQLADQLKQYQSSLTDARDLITDYIEAIEMGNDVSHNPQFASLANPQSLQKYLQPLCGDIAFSVDETSLTEAICDYGKIELQTSVDLKANITRLCGANNDDNADEIAADNPHIIITADGDEAKRADMESPLQLQPQPLQLQPHPQPQQPRRLEGIGFVNALTPAQIDNRLQQLRPRLDEWEPSKAQQKANQKAAKRKTSFIGGLFADTDCNRIVCKDTFGAWLTGSRPDYHCLDLSNGILTDGMDDVKRERLKQILAFQQKIIDTHENARLKQCLEAVKVLKIGGKNTELDDKVLVWILTILTSQYSTVTHIIIEKPYELDHRSVQLFCDALHSAHLCVSESQRFECRLNLRMLQLWCTPDAQCIGLLKDSVSNYTDVKHIVINGSEYERIHFGAFADNNEKSNWRLKPNVRDKL